jgi:hypothetical protein
MGGGKGGYSSSPPAEIKKTAKQKRLEDLVALRHQLKYLEGRLKVLSAESDTILKQLKKRDYDRFKHFTTSKEEKEEILGDLRAIDFDRFKALQRDISVHQGHIKSHHVKIKALERGDDIQNKD